MRAPSAHGSQNEFKNVRALFQWPRKARRRAPGARRGDRTAVQAARACQTPMAMEIARMSPVVVPAMRFMA